MNLKRETIIAILGLSGIVGFCLSIYQHRSPVPQHYTIQTRQTVHYPAFFVKQLKDGPDAGRKIFNEFCAACHSKEPVIDVNAPRIGDKKAWDSRRKMGMDRLLQITIKGIGAMPARGGCFECNDAALKQAVQYLLK